MSLLLSNTFCTLQMELGETVANLIEKDIPDSKSQMEWKGIRKYSYEPLACIHARIYHFLGKMFS